MSTTTTETAGLVAMAISLPVPDRTGEGYDVWEVEDSTWFTVQTHEASGQVCLNVGCPGGNTGVGQFVQLKLSTDVAERLGLAVLAAKTRLAEQKAVP